MFDPGNSERAPLHSPFRIKKPSETKVRVDKLDLVDKGLELMYLRGFNDVSIKDLVDAAGMPKGSFYNHFKSKEDFGLAVIDRYGELWHYDIHRFLGDATLPGQTTL